MTCYDRLIETPSLRAFTLIELLATIAIVAVLAALLFAGYKSAILQANKVKVVSNIRQQLMANRLQMNDLMPRFAWRSQYLNWGEVAEQLVPYLNDNLRVFDDPANPGPYKNPDMTILGNDPFFPSDPSMWTEFMYNGYACQTWGQDPSQTQYSLTKTPYISCLPYWAPNAPYPKSEPVGYLDGRVEWVPLVDFASGAFSWKSGTPYE
ncbi:MAG: type II secretion system protein [Verrucomicrobiota bacterium]